LAWRSTVSEIVKDRAAGKNGSLVLVGHSQGANNVIEMARLLEKEKLPVDLLVTLAPLFQDPLPGNVVRAINYYHSPGWGSPMLVFMASSRTSISAVTWAFPTSPWTRAQRSKRKLSAPSWPCRRRDRGRKNCEQSVRSEQPSRAVSAVRSSQPSRR